MTKVISGEAIACQLDRVLGGEAHALERPNPVFVDRNGKTYSGAYQTDGLSVRVVGPKGVSKTMRIGGSKNSPGALASILLHEIIDEIERPPTASTGAAQGVALSPSRPHRRL